jgi:hypothetical protein
MSQPNKLTIDNDSVLYISKKPEEKILKHFEGKERMNVSGARYAYPTEIIIQCIQSTLHNVHMNRNVTWYSTNVYNYVN